MILSKYSEATSEIKVKPMPIQVDIRKTFLYKWGKEEGLKEGEQRGLTKGLKQGKREGLKEGISGIIQVKFGSQRAKQIKNILDKINDMNRLEKIKKEVIRAKTWEDFIKFLKNPNSKNKNSKGN
jgi:flagellar biosynthesis/type III secretory pathway protein FliH